MTRATTRKNLSAAERIAEITATATRIGLDEGLERITLRRVAEEIGVRPGLISHYFPEAEVLVATAFADASAKDRQALFASEAGDTPTERLRAFLGRAIPAEPNEVSRLWLNARNLSRYNTALRQTVAHEESKNREELIQILTLGVEAGEFATERVEQSALLIFILIDALTVYTNEDASSVTPLVGPVVYATTERELGLAPGVLSDGQI